HPVTLQHLGHDVAVPDLCTHEWDFAFLQRQLKPQVAHQGTNDATLETPTLLQIGRDHIEQLVAVDQSTGVINHHHPVAITIEGDAKIGTVFEHCLLQLSDMGRADIGVDIEAVRLRTDDHHFGSQLPKHAGRYLVGRTVSAIDHQLEAGKVGTGRHAALAELDIAPGRVVNSRSLAQLG